MSASTAGVIRAATCAAVRPRSAGRTISLWLIGMPPRIWREIFAEPDADEELLDLAERAARLHALGVGRELAHRLDVGRKPGEPVGRPLLAVEQTADDVAFDRDPLAHLHDGVCQQGVERAAASRAS